jgi:hypothetical protein
VEPLRKTLPIWITVVAGLLVILDKYVFAVNSLGITANYLDEFYLLAYSVTILIGHFNLTRIHVNNVRRRKEEWYFSVVLLVAMWAYLLLGLMQTLDGPLASWIYNTVYVPMESTIFSMLAFFIASAAYRAFRVRSAEATILMLAGFIVLLGNTPIGSTISMSIPAAKNLLNDIPNAAGMQAILIGGFIGTFAVSTRILLGIERAFLGGNN